MTDLNTFFELARQEMVEQIALHTNAVSEQIGKTALADNVMAVMGRVPRHEFVPEPIQLYAYIDRPLPIGFSKTTSQPFIVALMTDLLDLHPEDRVLEIGAGLGYHAAILANLAQSVYTVEIITELAQDAETRLEQLGYDNIVLKIGNGAGGWPAQAPFDKILVTAAPELIPPALLKQLKDGGKMVIPTGLPDAQTLMLVEKDRRGSTRTRDILAVRFASLIIAH